jgi:hypothetical protein
MHFDGILLSDHWGEGEISFINSTGIHEQHSDFDYTRIIMNKRNSYYVSNIERTVQAPDIQPPATHCMCPGSKTDVMVNINIKFCYRKPQNTCS